MKYNSKHTIHGHPGCQTQLGKTAVNTNMMIHWLLASSKYISSQEQYSLMLLQITHYITRIMLNKKSKRIC